MSKPLINAGEATVQAFGNGEHFGCSMAEVASTVPRFISFDRAAS